MFTLVGQCIVGYSLMHGVTMKSTGYTDTRRCLNRTSHMIIMAVINGTRANTFNKKWNKES